MEKTALGYLSGTSLPLSSSSTISEPERIKLKYPTQVMEKLEFRLDVAPDLRCEQKAECLPVCQKCETCVLAWKIFSTREWFRRISERSQQQFLVRVLKRLKSLELLDYFEKVLTSSQGKDFTYFRCRAIINRKTGHKITCSIIKKMDEKVKDSMLDTLRWFGNCSCRSKIHYTLLLLQMCDSHLLFIAASVIRFLIGRQLRIGEVNLEEDPDVALPDNLKESHHNCETYSLPHTFSLKRTSKGQSFFDDKGQIEDFNFSGMMDISEKMNTQDLWGSRWSSVDKSFSGRRLRRVEDVQLPLYKEPFSKRADQVMEDEHFTAHLTSHLDHRQQLQEISKGKDFIRCLPVHISKYILAFLDNKTLSKCLLVSRHWSLLTHQVNTDKAAHQLVKNEIILLKETYSKRMYSNYASILGIPVPKADEDNKVIRQKTSKLKLKSKIEYNIWTAYQGQETETVQMEEKNIFCGKYNIRILSDRWDSSRVIHFCGGQFVAMTVHRKILLLDINHIKKVPTYFQGHSGGIWALILCEKESFLLSGSHDLSIRYWNIRSGLCTKIFNGHTGTITCLDLYENKLVSGSKDCQVKVWDMDTGRCLKTFKHKDAVITAKISSTHIVSGCEQGLVKVWHLATATLVKTLNGHEGPIKCLCFDEWHLLTGSNDGFVMGWSMVGKYERCLIAFKHPREVLCVAFLYLRVISGCADGNIRIYNFLNGSCLKVIKANSRGDPVLSFFTEDNRMVINTESNVLMFEFDEVKWQYYTDKNRSTIKSSREIKEEELVEYKTSHPKIHLEIEAKHPAGSHKST